MKFSKKVTLFAVVGVALYLLLNYHLIFIGNSVKFLKKSRLTLEYTLFSAKGKSNESILAIDDLREDGIGDLLVESGRLTEEELENILLKYEQ